MRIRCVEQDFVPSFELRDFQATAVTTLQALLLSATSVLLQSATGSGKTVMAGAFVREYLLENPNHKVLCLANLQALVGQIHDTMRDFGVGVSVLHDELSKNKDGVPYVLDYDHHRFLLTMPTTFKQTVAKQNQLHYDPDWIPTLILIDEAHKGTSLTFQLIKMQFPDAKIVGLTATPYRSQNDDGELLSDWYGELIQTVSVKELIALGSLVQPKYYSYKKDSNIVKIWRERTALLSPANRSTIIFSQSTDHSYKLKEQFLKAGVKAEVITSGNDDYKKQTALQRQAIYNDFEQGKIEVLLSYSALCEGFDCPRANFCFITRGVSTPALFQQMVGRVLRPYTDMSRNYVKEHGFIVDFGDNIKKHGHIENYQWSLANCAPDTMFTSEGQKELNMGTFERKSSIYHDCKGTGCFHVYDLKQSFTCSECGTVGKIKLKEEVGAHFERKLGVQLTLPLLKKIKMRYNMARTGYKGNGVTGVHLWNLDVGLDVFTNDDGELIPDAVFLDQVVKQNLNMTDHLYF